MDTLNLYKFGRIIAKKVNHQRELPKNAILLKYDFFVNECFEIDFSKEVSIYTTNKKTYYIVKNK